MIPTSIEWIVDEKIFATSNVQILLQVTIGF